MSEPGLSTDDVRDVVVDHLYNTPERAAEEFDAWIAKVERAAAEKALDSVGEVLWVHRKSGGGPDDRYAGMMRARFLVMQSASAYRREETE